MKLKYLLLAILLVVLPVMGMAADAVPVTASPTTTETSKIISDTANKVGTAVADGVGVKLDKAIGAVKDGAASAVASAKETVDNVAPPKVRGEFAELVLEKMRKYSAAGENAVSKAIDEIQEQTPIIIKEYLHWHLAQNLFYVVLTDVSFIFLVVMFCKTFPKWLSSLTETTNPHKTTDVDVKQFKYGASGILSGIFSAVVLWIILAHLEWYLDSIKIMIAPRVYLIEQVAGFVQQIRGQ